MNDYDMPEDLGKIISHQTYCSASSPKEPIKIMKTETEGSFVMIEAILLGLMKYLFRLASLKRYAFNSNFKTASTWDLLRTLKELRIIKDFYLSNVSTITSI